MVGRGWDMVRKNRQSFDGITLVLTIRKLEMLISLTKINDAPSL
jgi:hypothetical protein